MLPRFPQARAGGGCLSPLPPLPSPSPQEERRDAFGGGFGGLRGGEAAGPELEEELRVWRISRAAARLIKNLCGLFGKISRCQNQILLKLSAWLWKGHTKNHTMCLRALSNTSWTLLGWCCDHLPGKPVPVPNYALREEVVSDCKSFYLH